MAYGATSTAGTANRGSAINTLGWIECSISIVLVAARIYTRARLTHNVGIDDWTVLLALVRLYPINDDSNGCTDL